MQVARRSVHRDLPVHEAAQRHRERRNVFGEHRRVGDDDDVAREPLAFAREKRLEVRRADLFFAFDDDLDVDRQLAVDAQVRFDRGEVHQALALVVDRAAPVDLAVAHRRFERRRRPELERIGRLHVVMAVDQDRRRARRAEPRAVRDRMAAGFEHLGSVSPAARMRADRVLGGAPHVGGVIGLGGDRRKGDPGLELVEIALAVGANVIDEGVGVGGDHAAPFADARLGCFVVSSSAMRTAAPARALAWSAGAGVRGASSATRPAIARVRRAARRGRCARAGARRRARSRSASP